MSPSCQVAKSEDDRSKAKDAFNKCVETVDSIVGDACILHSWLIANGVERYDNDIGPANMPKELYRVSDGLLHQYLQDQEMPWTEHEKLKHVVSIAGNALDDNETECEDASLPRSGMQTTAATLWHGHR